MRLQPATSKFVCAYIVSQTRLSRNLWIAIAIVIAIATAIDIAIAVAIAIAIAIAITLAIASVAPWFYTSCIYYCC